MRKWFIILLAALVCLMPGAVSAQEGLKLSSLEVDLRPEYDRPDVLVIYRATLSQAASLPVDLTFRIPAAAGAPHAVAMRQADDRLLNAVYDRQVSGEWSLITLTATTPEIQLEYYDPGLQKQGATRHYQYQWSGEYAVDSLVVQVQQPVESSEMLISPSLGSGLKGADGLLYYTAQVGSLTKGQAFTITLDYQKASDTLSAETLPVQPSQPLTPDRAGNIWLAGALPWLIGLAGLALIVGGGWWYWHSGREVSQTGKRKRRRPSGREAGQVINAEGVYCQQCGKRAAQGDRFCRSCGERLRVE